MARSFYDILGVESDAEAKEIKRAFRMLAQHVHPDKVGSLPEKERAHARQVYDRLHEAYTALSSPETRKLYDECQAAGKDYKAELEANRPETAAERSAREAAEKAHQQAVDETLADLELGLSRLDPTRRWEQSEETYDYFERVLISRKGTRCDNLHVKILAELSPGDLPGVTGHADQMLALGSSGMAIDQYAYLLVGRTLRNRSILEKEVAAFNQRAYAAVSGRKPRAFLAFCAVEDGAPVQPGAEGADPDLARVFAAATTPSGVGGETGSEADRTPVPSQGVILIVDDDPIVLEYMRDLLEGKGYQVATASDWGSFRQAVLSHEVATILLDVNLPNITGDKLAMFVKSSPEIDPKPPILLHSGLDAGELRRLSRRIGALNFLPKGTDDERVLRIVGAAVEAFRASG